MSVRLRFERSNEIGAFTRLTNSYCLIAPGASETLYSLFQNNAGRIPNIQTTISGCRVIGRLCVGNKNGLLVPTSTTDLELQTLRENLPDNVKVECVEEALSALGNVICCNDKTALVHSDIDKDTEEIISDVLNVDVFRQPIPKMSLTGSYIVLSNYGGLVCPKVSVEEQEELSSLLDIPINISTVNRGSDILGAGIAINDLCAFCGIKCTRKELAVIELLFEKRPCYCWGCEKRRRGVISRKSRYFK